MNATLQNEPERFVGHPIRLPVFRGPLDLLLPPVRANCLKLRQPMPFDKIYLERIG